MTVPKLKWQCCKRWMPTPLAPTRHLSQGWELALLTNHDSLPPRGVPDVT